MCFSATASFSAAAVLVCVGIANLKQIKDHRLLLLAVVPFIFAFQQFFEGLTWLIPTSSWTKYPFVIVALGIWSIWIPLSVLVIETVPWRQKCLKVLLAFGVIYSVIFLIQFTLMPKQEITADIVNQSIQYRLPLQHRELYTWLYFAATLLPLFFSSYPGAWIVGIIFVVTALITYYFYNFAFFSVWCFFAAWISMSVFGVLHYNRGKLP